MIYSVIVKDPKKTPVAWWAKVPYLQRDRFDFGPGLNLFFGPNGSGKTTILRALARTFCCAQGGTPCLTQTFVHELTSSSPFGSHTIEALQGLDVRHDGRIVGYFDPGHQIGVRGGSFDDDFFEDGLLSCFTRGSSGELHMDGMVRILNQDPQFVDRIGEKVNDLWLGWRKQVLDVQKANELDGPPTVMLDEPERSLDIPRRAKLWQTLQLYAKKRQILLATHDPFALFMALGAGEDVRVLETAPGYVEACWKTLGAVADLANLTPDLSERSGLAGSAWRGWKGVQGTASGSPAEIVAQGAGNVGTELGTSSSGSSMGTEPEGKP